MRRVRDREGPGSKSRAPRPPPPDHHSSTPRRGVRRRTQSRVLRLRLELRSDRD